MALVKSNSVPGALMRNGSDNTIVPMIAIMSPLIIIWLLACLQ